MSKKCKNCGEDLLGNYCYRCGQKASTGRITMRYFFHELEYGLTHADRKGLFFTLKSLFTRPGNMLRDYILGHRVNYVKPFPLLIVLAGAYGILRHFIFPQEGAEVDNIPGEWLVKMPFLVYLQPTIKWMLTSQTFGVLVLLPFFALAVKKAFRRVGIKRYNYAECLYMSAYMACQRLIICFLFLPLALFADKKTDDEPGMFWQFVLYFILSAWTFKQFFRINVKTAVWKTIRVGIYMVLFLTPILAGLIALIFWVLYMYDIPLGADI